MCTSIVHLTAADGMAKDGADWFPVDQAVVAYDHARHAVAGDVITIDFFNRALGPGTRAGVELTLDAAKALAAVLEKAIAEAEIEEAEVRGVAAPAPRVVLSEPLSRDVPWQVTPQQAVRPASAAA